MANNILPYTYNQIISIAANYLASYVKGNAERSGSFRSPVMLGGGDTRPVYLEQSYREIAIPAVPAATIKARLNQFLASMGLSDKKRNENVTRNAFINLMSGIAAFVEKNFGLVICEKPNNSVFYGVRFLGGGNPTSGKNLLSDEFISNTVKYASVSAAIPIVMHAAINKLSNISVIRMTMSVTSSSSSSSSCSSSSSSCSSSLFIAYQKISRI